MEIDSPKARVSTAAPQSRRTHVAKVIDHPVSPLTIELKDGDLVLPQIAPQKNSLKSDDKAASTDVSAARILPQLSSVTLPQVSSPSGSPKSRHSSFHVNSRDAFLTLEELDYMKQLFEVYEFVRTRTGETAGLTADGGSSAGMPSPEPAPTEEGARPTNISAAIAKAKSSRALRKPRGRGNKHRNSGAFDDMDASSDSMYDVDGNPSGGVRLPALRRGDAAWNRDDYRRYIFKLNEERERTGDDAIPRGMRIYDFSFFEETTKRAVADGVGQQPGTYVPEQNAHGGNDAPLMLGEAERSTISSSTAVSQAEVPAVQFSQECMDGYHIHLSTCQGIVRSEVAVMETWKRQQRILRSEAIAERTSAAAMEGLTDTKSLLLPHDVLPFSAGVPLEYFASQVIAPYLHRFLPELVQRGHRVPWSPKGPSSPKSGPFSPTKKGADAHTSVSYLSYAPEFGSSSTTALMPWRPKHLQAVQNLFRMMDTNADGLVSWDEFTFFVLSAEQQRLCAHNAAAAAAASGTSANPHGSISLEQGIEYELTFTPTPTNSSPWQSTYPLVKFLYHYEPMTKLLVSERSRRYMTAGPDGLVKLWRPDNRLCDAQNRPAIVHERNLLSARSPITGICISPPSLGDAEVAAVTAMDGTVTLLRTATGETVRTLLGFRGAGEEQISAAMSEVRGRTGQDREMKEFEADDLLSLRNRSVGVSGTVIRLPYTVRAYRDDAMEIFFGQTNQYFHGLGVMAPTYEHLKRPVISTSDVLYNFGAENLVRDENTPKCWFSTCLAMCCYTLTATQSPIPEGAYMALGFESGVVQLYKINMNWFSVNQISATRVEPPSARRPSYSAVFHRSPVSQIIVSEQSDLFMTASDDGTIQVRAFSRFDIPVLKLGDGVPLPNRRFAASSLPVIVPMGERSGHTKRILCTCWNETHHLLVTGGMDHTVFFWSSRSRRPLRWIDLREVSNTVPELANLGACGYPIDVSFVERRQDPLRIIVLDSRRVIRIFNAFTCAFMGVLVDDCAESLALGEMHVARYEPMDDRLLLGGTCLRVWDIPREEEYAHDYTGHHKPVLFMCWHTGLQSFVTADEDHICVWRLTVVPYETALQQRHQRADDRRRAIKKAREVAARNKLLRAAQRAKEMADARGSQSPAEDNKSQSDETDVSSCFGSSLSGAPPPMVRSDSIDMLRRTPEEEMDDEAFAKTIYLAPELSPDYPTDDPLNPYNQTYWRSQSQLERSWDVPAGIRCMTVMPDSSQTGAANPSTAGGIFVALSRENAIIQYNPFNGAVLRRFTFPGACADVFNLCAGQAILTGSSLLEAPIMCAVFEESLETGVASVYHLLYEGSGDTKDSTGGTVLGDELRNEKKKMADSATVRPPAEEEEKKDAEPHVEGSIPPHRNLLFKESMVTSVSLLTASGLIAIGGRNSLYVTPISELSHYAIPLRTLEDQHRLHAARHNTMYNEDKEKDPASACDMPSDNVVVLANGSVPLDLIALFPGHLVPRPRDTEDIMNELLAAAKNKGTEEQQPNSARTASLSPGRSASSIQVPSMERSASDAASRAMNNNNNSTMLVAASEAGVSNADVSQTSATTRFLEERQAASVGFIGHLMPLCDTGYILSGSNNGHLRLWNVKSSSEILRFSSSLGGGTITCMSLSGMQSDRPAASLASERAAKKKSSKSQAKKRRYGKYFAAIGDQSGMLLLLDLNNIPWEEDTPLDMIDGLWEKVVVVDRWRAHRQDIRGISFVNEPIVIGGYEDVVQPETYGSSGLAAPGAPSVMSTSLTMVTTGEDSYVFVWRWQTGVLHCLGCFGAGAKTPVDPPLPQPQAHLIEVFEAARRQYVLQRLVREKGYFVSSANAPSALELDSAISLMDQDASMFMTMEGKQWEFAAYSSMAFHPSKVKRRKKKNTPIIAEESFSMDPSVGDSSSFLPHVYTVFDKAGMDGVLYRIVDQRRETLRSATSGTASVADGPFGLRRHGPLNARGGRPTFCTSKEPSLSSSAVYVLAFMHGSYNEKSARDCLQRTVENLKPQIKKLRRETSKAVRRASQNLRAMSQFSTGNQNATGRRSEGINTPSLGRATPDVVPILTTPRDELQEHHSQGPLDAESQFAATWRPGDELTNTPQSMLPAPQYQGGASVTSSAGRPSAPSSAGDSKRRALISIHSDTDVSSVASSRKDMLATKPAAGETRAPSPPPAFVEDGDQEEGDEEIIRLRGAALPNYRVRFGNNNAMLRISSTSLPTSHRAKAVDDTLDLFNTMSSIASVNHARRLMPKIVAARYRRRAAHVSPVDALSTEKLDVSADGRKGRMGNGEKFFAQQEEDTNKVLEEGGAAAVMQFAYLHRRRDEALQKLMHLQQVELENRMMNQKGNRRLAVEAGLVGLASYDDFSATGTSTVFFGTEKLLMDSPLEDPNRRIIGAAFVQDIMEGKRGAPMRGGANEDDDEDAEEEEVDWYTARERMKHKRKNAEALWAPSRVMLTLMDWESPIPPNGRPSSTTNNAGRLHRLYQVGDDGEDPNNEDGLSIIEDDGRESQCSRQPSAGIRLHRDHETNLRCAPSKEQMRLDIPAILLPTMQLTAPQMIPTAVPPTTGTLAPLEPRASMAVEDIKGLEAAAVAAAEFLTFEKKEINLNELVAAEIDAMRARMRQSIQEREGFLREEREAQQNDEEGEEEEEGEDEGGAETIPKRPAPVSNRRRMSSAGTSATSASHQPRPPQGGLVRTRKLADRNKTQPRAMKARRPSVNTM